MTTSMPMRIAAACALGALAFSSDVSAQDAPPDAWQMLPALSTTCYVDDDFGNRLGAAGEALQEEVDTDIFDKQVAHQKTGDAMMIVQMQALDLPGGGYRSTYALQQAYNFRTRLNTIWSIRYHKAEATARMPLKGECKDYGWIREATGRGRNTGVHPNAQSERSATPAECVSRRAD